MQPTTGGCFPPLEGGQEGSGWPPLTTVFTLVQSTYLIYLYVLFWMDDLLFLGGVNVTPHAGSMTLE